MSAVTLPIEPCEICTNRYLDSRGYIPKILPCGHTFCERCLERFRSMGGRKCPTCRRENFPPSWEKFTTNFIVYKSFVQQVKESERVLHEGNPDRRRLSRMLENLALARDCIGRRDYMSAQGYLAALEAENARLYLDRDQHDRYFSLWLEYAQGRGTVSAKLEVLELIGRRRQIPEYPEVVLRLCEFCGSQKASEVRVFLRELKDAPNIQLDVRRRAILQLGCNLSLEKYPDGFPGDRPTPQCFMGRNYAYYVEPQLRWKEAEELFIQLQDVEDSAIRRAAGKELASLYGKRGEFHSEAAVLNSLAYECPADSPEQIDAMIELARFYRKMGGDSLPLRDRVVEQIIQNPAATGEQKTQAKKLLGYEVFDKCSVQ